MGYISSFQPHIKLPAHGMKKANAHGGSLWTLKSVLARQWRENTEYPDAAITWLLHAYSLASSGMGFKKKKKKKKKKKIAPPLRGNCVRVPMDPPLTTNGTTLDKYNFPHTRDLWSLVAIPGTIEQRGLETNHQSLSYEHTMLVAGAFLWCVFIWGTQNLP